MSSNVYGVTQLNQYLAGLVKEDFLLSHIAVRGEVSNLTYHRSGHVYFTLKDEGGCLGAIMYSGSRTRGLKFPMKEGDEVIVSGSIDIYVKGGRYQIIAREIILAGAGDLNRRFEELKASLEEMGMFAAEYKKPIPKYAHRIGIVTAPTGAAVRDIIQISKRRNPSVELILFPALVQGEGAAESICQGIASLDQMGLDVIIVGRGGGSLEDLWAFNEEIVAREIFDCETPIISAVGHETDTTIADYVADLRAPTPSAAAELANYNIAEERARIADYQRSMYAAMQRKLENGRRHLMELQRSLQHLSPVNRLNEQRQYALALEERLEHAFSDCLIRQKHRLSMLAGQLEALSPARKLESGYAYVAREGKRVRSVGEITPGEEITLNFKDGSATAEITGVLPSAK